MKVVAELLDLAVVASVDVEFGAILAQAGWAGSTPCGEATLPPPTPMAEYTLITDPNLQSRVRERYEAEIASLQGLGFRTLAFALEALGPYSAVLQLPMLLLMLPKKEVLVFPRPLRLAVATVLLAHADPPTIALCMGMGVKLYTGFVDKTLLISSTFRSHAVPRPTSPIIRPPPLPSVEDVWPAHGQHVRELEAQSKVVNPTVSFVEYVEMSRREEDLSQYQ